MSQNSLYDIRQAQPDDYNFILATWLRGLYYGDSVFSDVPKDIFMAEFKKVAERTLTNPNVDIQVACSKEDPTVLFGYSITSKDQKGLVWVFVKVAFRKMGIGKSLLPKDFQYAMFLTALGKSLLKKFNVYYNPF